MFVSTDNKMHAGDAPGMSNKVFFWKGRLVSVTSEQFCVIVICLCLSDHVFFVLQLGYEPVPPMPTTTFFGKKVLAYPNVFQYCEYYVTQRHASNDVDVYILLHLWFLSNHNILCM